MSDLGNVPSTPYIQKDTYFCRRLPASGLTGWYTAIETDFAESIIASILPNKSFLVLIAAEELWPPLRAPFRLKVHPELQDEHDASFRLLFAANSSCGHRHLPLEFSSWR